MPRRDPPCPQVDKHTPHPTGYVARHEWAERKAKTHEQIRCEGCGRLAIWVPKTAARDPTTGHRQDEPDDSNDGGK